MRRSIVNVRLLALLAGAAWVLAEAMAPIAVAAEATATPPTEQPIVVAAQQPIAAEPPMIVTAEPSIAAKQPRVVVADQPAPGALPRTTPAQQWSIFLPDRPRLHRRKVARIAPPAKKRRPSALISVASRADFLSPHHSYQLVGVGFGF
jgi:hypothetical protein